MYALMNCDIYTGDGVEHDKALVIEGDRIHGLATLESLGPDIEQRDLAGKSVAPGFIDIQVNGGGGVLFNDLPSREGIAQIATGHRKFGTTNLLPTYITGPATGMAKAVEAVNTTIRDGSVRGVIGIHLEGPFINEAKAGVHDQRFIRKPNEEDLAIMLGPHEGVAIVTLAPEVVGSEVVERLRKSGVLVSLGHTNATCAEARECLDQGASAVTHLYNAMSGLSSRAPGVVGAALDHRDSWAGMIIDGFHSDFTSARVAVRAKGTRKVLLVTDAMPPVGASEPDTTFRLGDYRVQVDGGRCVTEGGVLAGSALDMATAVRNCVQKLGLPKDEALRMASTYPAEFLGLESRLGRVAAGFSANLTILNNQMIVSAVVIEGEYEEVN